MSISYMKFSSAFAVGIVMCAFLSCTSRNNTKTENETVSNEITSAPKAFELVVPLVTLTTPEGRADFIVRHYWDNFDFKDTAYIHLPEITEQAFANYIDLFSHVENETVDYSIDKTLSAAGNDPKMYAHFMELFKKYLYDPNSPLRNEEYYISVLVYAINSGRQEPTELTRLKFDLEMLKKNRLGEKSTDFTYTLSNGKTGTLYNIKNDYTLLMFYNPDCHSCEEITDFLKSSTVIADLLSSGKLALLAFYPDEDLEIWERHFFDIPDTWINGYDKKQVVTNQKLYDLKAIPTLYLLDKSKKVLLKDATAQQIETYLWNNVLRK